MRFFLFALLAFASVARADTWKLYFPTASDKTYTGHDVCALLNVPELRVNTVSVERFPVTGPLPRTEAEWQDFVVSHIHNGHNFHAERKVLLHSPRTVFVSETLYMESTDAKMEKLMAVVLNGAIYLFKANDFPRNFELNNAKYYKALFQDIAFGRREDLLSQIAANTAN
jgi:hypothetical protein